MRGSREQLLTRSTYILKIPSSQELGVASPDNGRVTSGGASGLKPVPKSKCGSIRWGDPLGKKGAAES